MKIEDLVSVKQMEAPIENYQFLKFGMDEQDNNTDFVGSLCLKMHNTVIQTENYRYSTSIKKRMYKDLTNSGIDVEAKTIQALNTEHERFISEKIINLISSLGTKNYQNIFPDNDNKIIKWIYKKLKYNKPHYINNMNGFIYNVSSLIASTSRTGQVNFIIVNPTEFLFIAYNSPFIFERNTSSDMNNISNMNYIQEQGTINNNIKVFTSHLVPNNTLLFGKSKNASMQGIIYGKFKSLNNDNYVYNRNTIDFEMYNQKMKKESDEIKYELEFREAIIATDDAHFNYCTVNYTLEKNHFLKTYYKKIKTKISNYGKGIKIRFTNK